MTRANLAWVALGLVACTEYRVRDEQLPPAQPPGQEENVLGRPPDNWQDCPNGLTGLYYNLPGDHPYLTGGRDEVALEELFTDDAFAFDRYDPSLEWGESWWPVDDGLAGDPGGFAVHWVGWIRGWSDSTVQMVLGAVTDATVLIDGEVVADVDSAEILEPLLYSHYLDGGVYPFEVRYAHRAGTSGMRFRVTGGDVSLCIPSYVDE